MKLSIVIPVYNEYSTLMDIFKRVESSLNELIGRIDDYEIVLIDDFSTDGTVDLIKTSLSDHPKVKTFFQTHNQGKGAALIRGFREVSGNIVLIQDADLEYDPQDYKKLLSPILDNKADVVYGSRFKGETMRVLYFWHSLGNKFLTFLSNMFSNLNLTDMETCYKVFKSDIIKNMNLTSKRFGIEPEMTAKIAKVDGIRIYEVPISYFGRTYSEGKKINWKDGVSALWCIFKFNFFETYESSFKVDSKKLLQQVEEPSK